MRLKEIVWKLTPDMFAKGADFDAAAFTALKEALPKRRRNTAVLVIVGAAMLIASVILAATVGEVPVIPCWLVFLVVAASLKVRKWNRRSKDAQNALGISRREINDALRRLKYISPWKNLWFYTAMVLALFLFFGVTISVFAFDYSSLWWLVAITILACAVYIVGVILFFKLNAKGIWFISSACLSAYIGIIISRLMDEHYNLDMEDIFGFALVCFMSLILLLTVIPIIKEKKRIKNM